MKRYYISKMIGTGSEEDPFRAKIADYNINHVIAASGVDWCFVKVAGSDFTPMGDDDDIFALPDMTFSATLGTIPQEKRAAIKAKLEILGVDTSLIKTTTTFGQLVRYLGRLHEMSFHEDNFDISE